MPLCIGPKVEEFKRVFLRKQAMNDCSLLIVICLFFKGVCFMKPTKILFVLFSLFFVLLLSCGGGASQDDYSMLLLAGGGKKSTPKITMTTTVSGSTYI